MKRIAIFLTATAITGLAGCSTSPEQLEQKAAASAIVKDYPDNYQEVYRRLFSVSSRCQSGNVGAYASVTVDAQLYNELNYGEISQSLINYGVRNYYWKAKIEKTEMGSRITVFAGNTIANGIVAKRIIRWADGGDTCMP